MYHAKGGNGYAAEDANALHDAWSFKEVRKVGVNRSLNGPDRIVGDVQIQSKYYQTARQSITKAFDGAKGQYRYPGQKLEIPYNQYREGVPIMQEKICNNQVPQVKDPAMASEILKQGNCSYNDSKNLKLPCTKQSLGFDVKSQAATSAATAALTATATYISERRNGASNKEALLKAGKNAGLNALLTGGSGVVTQQFLRTAAGRATDKVIQSTFEEGVKQVCKTGVGRAMLSQSAKALGKEAAAKATQRAALASVAKSNVITGAVLTAVTASIDTYHYFKGDISGKELTKNTASRAAGVAGGSAGWAAGAAAGTAICPGVGTVLGALGGAVLCGTGASAVVHKVFSKFGF